MDLLNRGADELARRLDEVAEDAHRPEADPVTDRSLVLAAQLRRAGAALEPAHAPRPEFRAALRTRLVAVATVAAAQDAATQDAAAQGVPAQGEVARSAARRAGRSTAWGAGRSTAWGAGRSSAPRGVRAPAALAGALASVVALGGVAAASSQSLPGDPFYGVKTAAEGLLLRTADGDVETGTRHLELAATRLRELRGLVLGRDAAQDDVTGDGPAADDPARLERTLDEMDRQTELGSSLLTRAAEDSGQSGPLEALSQFADQQADALALLLPVLPDGSSDRARTSLALAVATADQARALLDPAAGPAPGPAEPSGPAAPSTAPSSGPVVPSTGPATPTPPVSGPAVPGPGVPGPGAPAPGAPAPGAPAPGVPGPVAPGPVAPGPAVPGPGAPVPGAPRPTVPLPTGPRVPAVPGPAVPGAVVPELPLPTLSVPPLVGAGGALDPLLPGG